MMARKVGLRDPLWARLEDERDHTMSMPKALLLAVFVELLLFALLWLAFMNMKAKPDEPQPMVVTLEQLEPEKKLEGKKPQTAPKKETPKPQPPKPVEPPPPKVEEKVEPKPPEPQPEPEPEPVVPPRARASASARTGTRAEAITAFTATAAEAIATTGTGAAAPVPAGESRAAQTGTTEAGSQVRAQVDAGRANYRC